MEKYIRAIGLVVGAENRLGTWLTVWNDNSEQLEFITACGSHKDDLRPNLCQAITDQLGLTDRDILVSNMAQLHLEFAACLPGRQEITHNAIAFYQVHLYSRRARTSVEELEGVRWLPSKSLRNGRAMDGAVVDPILCFLLRRSDVIQEWSTQELTDHA